MAKLCNNIRSILELEKCCGFMDLRKGCLIIGYLYLFVVVGALIVIGTLVAATANALAADDGTNKDNVKYERNLAVLIIAAIFFVLLILALAFTVVLLVGITKNKRGLVKAHIIYSSIFQVIFFFQFIWYLATQPSVFGVIDYIIIICLQFYFFLVIRSYYYKMQDNP